MLLGKATKRGSLVALWCLECPRVSHRPVVQMCTAIGAVNEAALPGGIHELSGRAAPPDGSLQVAVGKPREAAVGAVLRGPHPEPDERPWPVGAEGSLEPQG